MYSDIGCACSNIVLRRIASACIVHSHFFFAQASFELSFCGLVKEVVMYPSLDSDHGHTVRLRLSSLATAPCTAQTFHLKVIDDSSNPRKGKAPTASSSDSNQGIGVPTNMLVAKSERIAMPIMLPLPLVRRATSVNRASLTDLHREDNVRIQKIHQAIARRLQEPAASVAES